MQIYEIYYLYGMPYLSNPALPFIREDYPGNRFENDQFLNDAHIEFDQPSFWDIAKWQMGKNPQKAEKKADEFMVEVIHGADFVTDERDLIVWLGHASFFIRLAGVSFLTDPCLRSLPMIPRKVGLPCDIHGLKGIDYLLLSHGHRDHFDKPSLQTIIPNNFGIEALVPLKLGEQLLRPMGINRYQEAGWYQQFETLQEVNVTFLPAKHWNRRGLTDFNRQLWGSFLIESHDKLIFFAGDSGYASYFQEIQEVILDEIDVCLMPVGAYKPRRIMKHAHTTPDEAVQAFQDLMGKTFIPMHYGTYDLSDEPPGEPIRRLKELDDAGQIGGRFAPLSVGEVLYL